MTPVVVFDIETIPDIAGLRALHELPDELSDSEVAEYAFQKQRAKNGSDFLPHHLQRVAVISFVLRSDEGFKVVSLAEPQQPGPYFLVQEPREDRNRPKPRPNPTLATRHSVPGTCPLAPRP